MTRRKQMTRTISLTLSIAAAGLVVGLSGCGGQPSLSFAKDIAPLLNKYCGECHLANGEGVEKSGFGISSYDAVMKGTKFGPVVVAGDSESSTLYRLVAGKVDKSIQMPHGKEQLADAEIAVIQNWIDHGAKP
jgi:hypothetical protein